jgi:hypothetical protein
MRAGGVVVNESALLETTCWVWQTGNVNSPCSSAQRGATSEASEADGSDFEVLMFLQIGWQTNNDNEA